MAQPAVVKIDRGNLKVGGKTVAKVTSIAEAKGFLKGRFGARFKDSVHKVHKVRKAKRKNKNPARNFMMILKSMAGGREYNMLQAPLRAHDIAEAKRKALAWAKGKGGDRVVLYSDGSVIWSNRVANPPKLKAKLKPTKRKNKRSVKSKRKPLSKAAFLKRMAAGRAKACKAKKNPRVRTPFTGPSHDWRVPLSDGRFKVVTAEGVVMARHIAERSLKGTGLKIVGKITKDPHSRTFNPKAKAKASKTKRAVPAAFLAAARKAKAMTPAQRAAWAKKMQVARKAAQHRRTA